MNNRIRHHSPQSVTETTGLGGPRFALIEPSPPQFFGPTSPSQLYQLAFLHARALVERTRWQQLLQKIFEQGE